MEPAGEQANYYLVYRPFLPATSVSDMLDLHYNIHSWLSYRPIWKQIYSTGLTGELGRSFTYISTATINAINQASTNPRIRAHQSINSIQRVQNIQSIKLEVLGLID
jgi:hypothetical protein